jgi:hypothetical protein
MQRAPELLQERPEPEKGASEMRVLQDKTASPFRFYELSGIRPRGRSHAARQSSGYGSVGPWEHSLPALSAVLFVLAFFPLFLLLLKLWR